MAEKYSIELEAKFSGINELRGLVMKKMQNRGFSEDEIYDVEVSVVELMENTVKHGYRFEDGKILFELEIFEDKVIATYIDFAEEFSILNYHGPNSAERLERGIGGLMGIKTIRAVCDDVSYLRENNCNKTILIKNKRGIAIS